MRFPSSIRLATWLLAASHVASTPSRGNRSDGSPLSASSAALDEHSDGRPRPIKFILFNAFDGDESYTLTIDGLPISAEGDSCELEGLADVSVNGHNLSPKIPLFDGGERDPYATLEGVVTAVGDGSNDSLSVSLRILAKCLDSVVGSDSFQETPFRASLFEISFAQPRSDTWYLVAADKSSRAFQSGRVNFQVSTLRPSLERHVHSDLDSAAVIRRPGTGDDSEFSGDILEQETYKLQVLRNELRHFQYSIGQQENLVDRLLYEKHLRVKQRTKDCQSIGCFFSTLYDSGKDCIHLAFLRLKAAHHLSSRSLNDCFYMDPDSKPAGATLLATNKNGCEPHYRTYFGESWPNVEVPLALKNDDRNGERTSSRVLAAPLQGTDQGSQSSAGAYKTHAFLALAASILCLGCVGTLLHQRYCSPRARADRAARREERRTMREYRCAARQQAWKDWWARQQGRFCRRGRCSSRRMNDYEEKRALIIQQEAVLESAMQDEIGRLQYNRRSPGLVGEVLSMAEEGRMPSPPLPTGSQQGHISVDTEQLPAYRSRASSGRPPSYHEFDEGSVAHIADGFTNYTPSRSGNDDARSVRSFTSDVTSESSVLELSPRHSSETLRTERSGV